MSTNTLATYSNGDIIDASHPNEITLALKGELVGRNSNGIPTPSQSLGTLAIPWGNVYADGLILNGLAVDTSQITSLPNRVVSGQTRSFSSMPDFLRANGAALEFDVLGATVDLVLSINNTAVSVSSDLNKTGITAAPSTNNTADINDTNISNDLFAGESDEGINELTIDAVGTEVSARVGQIVAFRTPTGEIFRGLLKDSTTITNVFRGFYFNSSGNPIERGNLSNNDTITLMNIGFVFIEDNGTTVDVSYRTPSISYNAPTSPQTGDYWFDISNQVWKRYSGTTFEIINRILVGEIVSDDTNTIASRSLDFSNPYNDFSNIDVDIQTSEIVESRLKSNVVNVYGTQIQIDFNKIQWNITTDLETGLIEAPDTKYFLYLSDEGQTVISDQKPFLRNDLKGKYHPYHSWRCVGEIYNDSSSDIDFVASLQYRSLDFSDWTRGEPITIDATTTAPTKAATTEDYVKWRRVGDSMELFYTYIASATGGSNGSGDYIFKIPENFRIDTSVVGSDSTLFTGTYDNDTLASTIGTTLFRSVSPNGATFHGWAFAYDETGFRVLMNGVNPNLTTCYPSTPMRSANWSVFSNRTLFHFRIKVPIQGWS